MRNFAEIICIVCGKPKLVFLCHARSGRAKYCSNECRHKGTIGKFKGEKSPRWKGGTFIREGYRHIKAEWHPKNKNGYCPEHLLVLEQKIGRMLEDHEQPHHISGIRTDNRPENLELTTISEHGKLHGNFLKLNKQRKETGIFKGSGNPFCGKKHTDEALAKMSAKAKGKPSPRKGVVLSEETKKKVSESLKRYHANKADMYR